jgi:hypothetical protein
MLFIRRRLWWLIVAWLVCQAGSLSAAPTLAVFGRTVDECCEGLGPGQACPMHHPSREGDRTCKMRSACPRGDAALISMAGGLGVLPDLTDVVTPFGLGDSVAAPAIKAIAHATSPESPPPRSSGPLQDSGGLS